MPVLRPAAALSVSCERVSENEGTEIFLLFLRRKSYKLLPSSLCLRATLEYLGRCQLFIPPIFVVRMASNPLLPRIPRSLTAPDAWLAILLASFLQYTQYTRRRDQREKGYVVHAGAKTKPKRHDAWSLVHEWLFTNLRMMVSPISDQASQLNAGMVVDLQSDRDLDHYAREAAAGRMPNKKTTKNNSGGRDDGNDKKRNIFHMYWTENKANKKNFFQQIGEWYLNDRCVGKEAHEISGAESEEKGKSKYGILSNHCCSAEPIITCHYHDKPTKIPCPNSPSIDKHGISFW